MLAIAATALAVSAVVVLARVRLGTAQGQGQGQGVGTAEPIASFGEEGELAVGDAAEIGPGATAAAPAGSGGSVAVVSSLYEMTPPVPDALPERFAVLPFENRTPIRALDYLRAGAAFALAEKVEANLGLAPAYGRLVVELPTPVITPAVPPAAAPPGPGAEPPPPPPPMISAESVARFAIARHASWIFTGWVRRPDWKLELGVTLWRIIAADGTTSSSPGTTDTALVATPIAEIIGKGEFGEVHALIGAAIIALADKAGWRLRPETPALLRAAPTRDLYAFTLLGRGLGHLMGIDGVINVAAAARDLDKAVFIDPFMVEAQRLDAIVRELEGRGARATGKYNYAIDLRPTYYPAIRGAAQAAIDTGKADLARELFDRMVRLRPWDLEARFGLGNAMWEVGDAAGALRELERVVAREPGHLRARRVLVLVVASRGAGADLVSQLEEVVKLAPDDQAARLDLGAAYVAVGRVPDAVATYEAVVSAKPDSVTANKLAGDVLRLIGRSAEAIEHYVRLIKLAPDDPRPYFLLGAMYLEAGDLDEARKMYQRVLTTRAHIGAGYTNLGAIAWQEGKLDDALWYLVRAVQRRPRSAIARYDLALVLLARGDRPRAAAEVEAALRLEPGYAAAQELARTLDVTARASAGEPVAPAAGSWLSLPGRPGGTAAVEVLYGPAELLRARLDRLQALENGMDAARAEVGRALHAVLRGTDAVHGRVCPVKTIARPYVEAERAAARFRELGTFFEDEYLLIARLDGLGESAALTPDYRWRVNQVQRRYRTAALDYRELRAEMKEQLVAELRYRGCSVAALQSAGSRPVASGLGEGGDEVEPGPEAPPPTGALVPGTEQPSVVGATVTFFVDNRTCAQPLRVYVDGEQRGVVPASGRAALQSQAGRRAMCLIPSNSRATCGDRGTVRTAYLHDGWSITMHCMRGTEVIQPKAEKLVEPVAPAPTEPVPEQLPQD